MSGLEVAFLVLAVGASLIFMMVVAWVDWSSSRLPPQT
jgi:hypothetical protein